MLSDQDEFLPVAKQWLGTPDECSPCLLRPRTTEKSEVEKLEEEEKGPKQVSGYWVYT